MAIRRIRQFNLDGYVLDVEKEYKQAGKKAAARRFMSQLRSAYPALPIALSSYRYPSLHPQVPWEGILGTLHAEHAAGLLDESPQPG